MAFKVGAGSDFEEDLVTTGIHDVVVAEVFDLGLRHSRWREGEMAHQGFFVLQTDEVSESGDFAGQPKELWKFFNVKAGISAKSSLGKFLEGWRGKPFSAEELATIRREQYDLEGRCTGKSLQVLVTHTISQNGKTRAQIEAALPPNKDAMKRLKVRDYTPIKERKQLDLDALFGERVLEMPVDNGPMGSAQPEEGEDLPF